MDETEKPAAPPSTGPVFGANIPPTFANQFHVSALGGTIRVVFGETILGSGDTFYPHSVTVMTTDRAAELAALINRIIKAVADAEKLQATGTASGGKSA